MSDSVRPHRQQPTRLCRPWDSPGKNTGVGCHFLLQCMKVKSESEVTQSCPTLATPWTAAYQASPSMGFSRQEYWSGVPLPSPGHSKHPLPTTREDSMYGHHQMVNTKIRLIIFFAAKDGEALYSQQKQAQELTVAQIMNSLLPNSDLN